MPPTFRHNGRAIRKGAVPTGGGGVRKGRTPPCPWPRRKPAMTRIITALSEISDHYEALFVDLWGCVHDGVRALPDAVSALQAYRAGGGVVVLVTNSPKPRKGV